MSTSDEFRNSTDVAEHNRRRLANDLSTLDQSWAANSKLLERVKLLASSDGFAMKGSWQTSGGADTKDPSVYNSPSKGIELTFKKGILGAASSLSVMLDMQGRYTLTYGGQVKNGQKEETPSQNKVFNLVNGWITDLGTHYNLDLLGSLLQRSNDVAERKAAEARQQPRPGK